MDLLATLTLQGLNLLAMIFVWAIGLAVLAVVVLFVIDRRQSHDAIRRNYPVIGRFRALFSNLGEFFRQYFFAMDREEMPFNRAEREWVYRSAAGVDNTVAFGSTKSLAPTGSIIFANGQFPVQETEATQPPEVVIGPGADHPYASRSIINISAMSYGAISRPAVLALSRGAKLAGCWLNTGEGGLSPYHLEGGADIVFQIGTAKYGVRDSAGRLDPARMKAIAAHSQVRMIELKLSQGAKPGKGGLLPGIKVTPEIAAIRGIPVGQDSISPNRHEEVASVPELLDLMSRLRDLAGKPVGFKTVFGDFDWLRGMCEEIHRRGIEHAPDFITIDSGDGGTGAAPLPLIDNCGILIREALPNVVDVLQEAGLRERIKIISAGKLVTPADVAWAYCAGTDFVASARGFMFALGCIQSLKCNRNTCPTGITTHEPRLQRGLDPADKAVRVKRFVDKMHYGVGLIAHSCGVPHARALQRKHCRLVQANGRSLSFAELYPPVSPGTAKGTAQRAAS